MGGCILAFYYHTQGDVPISRTWPIQDALGHYPPHPGPWPYVIPYVLPYYIQLSHCYSDFLDPHHFSCSRFLYFFQIAWQLANPLTFGQYPDCLSVVNSELSETTCSIRYPYMNLLLCEDFLNDNSSILLRHFLRERLSMIKAKTAWSQVVKCDQHRPAVRRSTGNVGGGVKRRGSMKSLSTILRICDTLFLFVSHDG
jgi:hypothetical protein